MLKAFLHSMMLSLACLLVSAGSAAEKRPVLVGFDGAYGLHNSTAPQSIELGLRVALGEINAAGGVLDGRPLQLVITDDWAMPAMLAQARDEGKHRIGVMLPNTGWGRSNQAALDRALSRFPTIEVVGIEWYNWGEETMIGKYQALLQKGANVLLLVANDNEAGMLVQELGAHPATARLPIVSHWGIAGGEMVKISGPTLQELDLSVVQTFSFLRARRDQVARFMRGANEVADIGDITEIKAPVGAGHAYDAMHILAKAIDIAGSTDREAVRDALESGIAHVGLVRDYQPAFRPDRHEALSPEQVFMARYREDGVLVPLK